MQFHCSNWSSVHTFRTKLKSSFFTCAHTVLKPEQRSYLWVDYPNVLCRNNMTRHMCLVNDMTQHDTKRQKNLKLKKWSCWDLNSRKCSTLTPDAIPLCYRAYTMKVGKNQNHISCWRYFVLYGVVLCHVVSYGVVSIGQSTYGGTADTFWGKNALLTHRGHPCLSKLCLHIYPRIEEGRNSSALV